MLHHALQVEDAIVRSLDGIVAEVLGETARVVGGVGFSVTEPESGIVFQTLGGDFLQFPVVAFGIVGSEHGTIAPLNRPLVIVADAGKDTAAGDAVLGLCDVVETGIVHDARRVTVAFHKTAAAQTVHGHQRGGAEIVAQAESVTDFVGGDETNELSHEFLVELHLARCFVKVAGLNHIPMMHKFHDVVIPADVAFKDFSAAWVVNLRAVGVGDGGSEITDDGESGIFHGHAVNAVGPLLRTNGVFETGFLKRFLPVVHALNEIGSPLLGGGRVDVIDNRFLWFNQFAASEAGGVGAVLRLQTPASDETLGLDVLLCVGVAFKTVGEVADARVEQACQHGRFGKQDE